MIPVIFIHFGNNYYIEKTVKFAVSTGNKVIFLGDKQNEMVSNIDGVEFHHFEKYVNDRCIKFLGKMSHKCLITKDGKEYIKDNFYRFFAMEKWIILSNFLYKNTQYDSVYMFDTDNFILDDLNKFDYSHFDFIRYTEAGFQSYIKTKIIHEFSNYLCERDLEYDTHIMGVTSDFIFEGNYNNYLQGDYMEYYGRIFDKCISLNCNNLFETIKDMGEKISHNENEVKMIYYDENSLYFKTKRGKFYKLLTLNLSWVRKDYFDDVCNFLINRKSIDYINFKKRIKTKIKIKKNPFEKVNKCKCIKKKL